MGRFTRTPADLKPPEEWCLSPTETEVMDAYVVLGAGEAVASSLGRAVLTVRCHTAAILRKSGAINMLTAAVAWDRYSRKGTS